MRTREDAKVYRRLNAYDLEDGIENLLEAIDEELDFEEEDDDDFEEEERAGLISTKRGKA